MIDIPSANESFAQNLYYSARERARQNGVESFDEYRDVVEDLMLESESYGKLDPSDDTVQIRRDLELMWPEYEREVAIRKNINMHF